MGKKKVATLTKRQRLNLQRQSLSYARTFVGASTASKLSISEEDLSFDAPDLNESILPQSQESTLSPDKTDFIIEVQSKEVDKCDISGNRLVNIKHLFKELKSIKHCGFNCSFFDQELITEKQIGLSSVFTFKCDVCGLISKINSDDSKSDENINKLAVSAILVTGGGYSQLKEMCSVLNIPTMSDKTYSHHHQSIAADFK